ncbi:MAG: response regulator [Sphingomonas sanxanigenens]|jgi:FixJ family two-component response regulator|uniref:Response regulator n=1 Tax=Sphingomonas sanxanigenens TaxID=397260 RepID=A0A2W5A1A5_9SPHN|nr:MAG: response regulator [Sphingomonas sanxanigenens]
MSTETQNPGEAPKARVLLVDDDEGVRRSLQLLLHGSGYSVRAHASASSILHEPPVDDIDMLVTDYRLPDGDGLGILRAMRRRGWDGRAVLITAFPSPLVRDCALSSGFAAVLEKPLRPYELFGALSG